MSSLSNVMTTGEVAALHVRSSEGPPVTLAFVNAET